MVHEVTVDYSSDELSVIAYHMSWPAPGNDPWYHAAPDEADNRRAYYGVNGIPQIFVGGDGTSISNNTLTNAINGQINDDTPLLITLEAFFDGDSIFVTATVEAEEGDYTIDNSKLHIVLTEAYEHWDTPAPNGMTDFYYPMIGMAPSGQGQTFTIEEGETLEFTEGFEFDGEWDVTNINVVSFIQSVTSDEVYQSANTIIDISVPSLGYSATSFDDDSQWRPNDRPDAGETVDMIVQISAADFFQPGLNISGTLSTDDDRVTINTDASTWADLQPGEFGTNSESPFSITVSEDIEPAYVTFDLNLIADEFDRVVTFDLLMGVPDILLVNDFGAGADYGLNWANTFESMGVIPDVSTTAEIFTTVLTDYATVIWTTGTDAGGSLIDISELLIIDNYLDNGGNLIFSSQYIGDTGAYTNLLADRFGVTHGEVRKGSEGVSRVNRSG